MVKTAPRNLRVVVFCMGIETVKHIAPLEYFGADRAHMLFLENKPLFKAFRKEVSKRANKILSEPLEEVEVKVYDFTSTMAELLKIVRKEKEAGKVVYMNLDGPPNYAAAAMITAMMEDCLTFFTPTIDHQIIDTKMFQDDDGNLIGLSKKVKDPVVVPKFQLRMPAEEVVKGLRVWRNRNEKGWIMTDAAVVEDLRKEKLMGKHNDVEKVTQSAKMYYRRHFKDKWEYLGWMEKDPNGKYALTEKGEVAADVFYVE